MAKWRIGTFPSASRADKGNDMPKRFIDTKAHRRAKSIRHGFPVDNSMPFDFDAFNTTLESGWTDKEKNVKKPSRNPTTSRVGTDGSKFNKPTHAKYNIFTTTYDEFGEPVVLRNGPGAGHSLMIENWESEEGHEKFYEQAFVANADSVQHLAEDEGHIVSMDYNPNMEALLVSFRNKGSVCLFRNVGMDQWTAFQSANGQIDNSRKPPHNHMIGVRFWDLVRIRGTIHGVQCNPWWYVDKGEAGIGETRVTGAAQRKAEMAMDEAIKRGNKFISGKKSSLSDEYREQIKSQQRAEIEAAVKDATKLRTNDVFNILDNLAVDPYVDKAIEKNPNGMLATLIQQFNSDRLALDSDETKKMAMAMKLWADGGYKSDINETLDEGDW